MMPTLDYTPPTPPSLYSYTEAPPTVMDLADFGALVIGLLDRELERGLRTPYQETVMDFLFRWYYVERLHHVLLPDALLKTVETVFKNEILRDWILNLTAQVQIHVQSWPDYWPDVIDQLVVGLQPIPLVETAEETVCLIPKPIQAQLQLDPAYSRAILSQNAWLVVLLIVYLFFHQSSYFRPLEPPLEDGKK